MMTLIELATACKHASTQMMNASSTKKNEVLNEIAKLLELHMDEILAANQLDLQHAKDQGMKAGLMDRMMLDENRMKQIIEGVVQVASLQDPIGEIRNMKTTANGLQIGTMRVALGVVGMIYEARPNVTVDAAVLCLKAGNAVMLRGSKDTLHSNIALVNVMQNALKNCGFAPEIISLLEDTSRETATQFMKLNGYLDVLIPRGGKALIQSTVQQATIPVLETGTGNCHVYIDEDADLKQALDIVINAKTSRTSVCNACESVLIHRSIRDTFIKQLLAALFEHKVTIHADMSICALNNQCILADEEDYAKEYLDLECSIKMVNSIEEAITHINQYSTHHSETIVSQNYSNVQKFLKEVDSACVYANASTRFSDGFEFGLGAEIGISTQKLHARGPMGLQALTTEKYIILGNGQIR